MIDSRLNFNDHLDCILKKASRKVKCLIMSQTLYEHKQKNQSGFKPGDSCISQLLSITHEIFKSFDDGLEIRSVFLGIPKAFDKVSHEGIIFKLEHNGIFGDLLNI